MKIEKQMTGWEWFKETWDMQSLLTLILNVQNKFNLDRKDISELKPGGIISINITDIREANYLINRLATKVVELGGNLT